jgi:hypothetical protein
MGLNTILLAAIFAASAIPSVMPLDLTYNRSTFDGRTVTARGWISVQSEGVWLLQSAKPDNEIKWPKLPRDCVNLALSDQQWRLIRRFNHRQVQILGKFIASPAAHEIVVLGECNDSLLIAESIRFMAINN